MSEKEKARLWVIKNGISNGQDPGKAVTRDQLWIMLYRCSNL